MNKETRALSELLTEAVENAKLFQATARYETTASAEMESESTRLTVWFDEAEAAKASLDLKMLLDRLEAETTLAQVTLSAGPEPQVIIHGAAGSENYQVVVQL